MLKRIDDLTERDKELFLEAVKVSMEREQGVPWPEMEKMIQAS